MKDKALKGLVVATVGVIAWSGLTNYGSPGHPSHRPAGREEDSSATIKAYQKCQQDVKDGWYGHCAIERNPAGQLEVIAYPGR